MDNPMLKCYIGHSKIMTEYLDGIYHCLKDGGVFYFFEILKTYAY